MEVLKENDLAYISGGNTPLTEEEVDCRVSYLVISIVNLNMMAISGLVGAIIGTPLVVPMCLILTDFTIMLASADSSPPDKESF